MANEFIARNGLIALNNTTVTGSLSVTGSVGIGTTTITGSLDVKGTTVVGVNSGGSTLGYGVNFAPIISASSNFNTLVGLNIAPVYVTGSFTNTAFRSITAPGFSVDENGWVRTPRIITSGDTFIGTLDFLNAPGMLIRNLSVINVGYWFANGHLRLGNEANYVDNGYRLQVNSSGSVSGSLYITGSASQTLLKVDSDVSSSILFVSGSGNIGIGTSTPGQLLDINAGSAASALIKFTAGSGVNAAQVGFLTGYGAIIGATSGNALYAHGTNIIFRSNDLVTEWMRINNAGIGIGTTSISASLHISGASSANLLRIDSPTTSSILFVTGSGNVGIGTSTPSYRLDVNGGPTGNNIARFTTGPAGGGTRGLVMSSDGTVFKAQVTDNAGSYGSWAYLSLNPNAGNVGVGTQSPTGRLQVKGTGTTSATTAFLLENANPSTLLTILDNGQHTYSGPLMILGTSQSAYVISQSISSSNTVGGQVYGVNITPTFWQTTASQTETAFRVAATFTQSSVLATAGTNIIADFGASSVGSQFTVTDVTSGSIYMVNDVSGLPIIEATSDWTVNMYNFPTKVFQKTGSQVIISGSLIMAATSSFVLPLTSSASPLTGSAFWSGSFLFIWDGSRYRSSSFA